MRSIYFELFGSPTSSALKTPRPVKAESTAAAARTSHDHFSDVGV